MSLESEPKASGPARLPQSSGGQRRRLLDDPLAIRALAHPLRLELLSIVGRAAEITTADAARELGISHGLASHHLHQLAKYGFVEQVGGKDNRERPWRAVHTSLELDPDPSPEGAAAGQVLETLAAEQGFRRFVDWLDRRTKWPREWREQTGGFQSNVYLTLDELTELNAMIQAAITRYVEERPIDELHTRPAGSIPINFTHFVVPLSAHPEES